MKNSLRVLLLGACLLVSRARAQEPPSPQARLPAPAAAPSQPAWTELMQVEAQLRELRAERASHSLTGPIIVTAIGFGGAALSGFAAWLSDHRAKTIRHNIAHPNETDCTFCPVEDPHKAVRADRFAHAFKIVSFVGLGVGAAGVVWLGVMLKRRRAHGEEIHTLDLRRRELLKSLRFGGSASPGALGLTLSARF